MPKKAAKQNKVEKIKPTVYTGRQVMRGLVVATKLPKTVTVVVERSKMHPLYHKAFKRSKRYLVHDEIGVKEGDLVNIGQIKPISKNKHFKVLNIVGQDIAAIVSEQLKEEAAEAIAQVMPEEKEEQVEAALEASMTEEVKGQTKSQKEAAKRIEKKPKQKVEKEES